MAEHRVKKVLINKLLFSEVLPLVSLCSILFGFSLTSKIMLTCNHPSNINGYEVSEYKLRNLVGHFKGPMTYFYQRTLSIALVPYRFVSISRAETIIYLHTY